MNTHHSKEVEPAVTRCDHCECQKRSFEAFTMAFQPIWNCRTQSVFGYEALVRGLNNEPAYQILSQVNQENKYAFDQQCRAKAIKLAAKLGMKEMLSINFLPNAVYEPERCLATTLKLANKYDFPTSQIMFEFTEVERIEDTEHVRNIVEYYHRLGFKTAIDDFGAGYSGLNLLADFQTNIAKLDMGLIRGIDQSHSRQTIVRNMVVMLNELQITPLAEGVETLQEYQFLHSIGVELIQGYFIAKPGFESLPEVTIPPL